MIITNALIASLNPCKDRHDNYLEHYVGREHTPAQFMGLKHITHVDKLWVALRLLTPEQRTKASAEFARRVLHIYEAAYPGDIRPRRAIEAAEAGRYDDAAYAAANAARAAAVYAAANAARAAAVYAAARAAYDAPNREAEEKAQRRILIRYLKEALR